MQQLQSFSESVSALGDNAGRTTQVQDGCADCVRLGNRDRRRRGAADGKTAVQRSERGTVMRAFGVVYGDSELGNFAWRGGN